MSTARLHRRTTALTAAAVIALATVAGCASGSDNSSSAGRAADSAVGGRAAEAPQSGAEPASPQGDAAKGSAGGYAAKGGTGVDPALLGAATSDLARRATVALRVKDIGAAVSSIRATSAGAEGIILSENIGSASDDAVLQERSKVNATTYGEITISVPSSRLDGVLSDLGKLGTLIRSGVTSDNLKTQIVDTDSRVKTIRASVDRVRSLMAQTSNITQIVQLESELSRRQADLEALESQLASLKDSVARSPIQISLTTEPDVIARDDDAGTGFLAGFTAGWDAFAGSVVVVLTVLGALLPFLFVLALVGIPLWLVLRRRRVTAPPSTPSTVLSE